MTIRDDEIDAAVAKALDYPLALARVYPTPYQSTDGLVADLQAALAEQAPTWPPNVVEAYANAADLAREILTARAADPVLRLDWMDGPSELATLLDTLRCTCEIDRLSAVEGVEFERYQGSTILIAWIGFLKLAELPFGVPLETVEQIVKHKIRVAWPSAPAGVVRAVNEVVASAVVDAPLA